jgi:hypothetical protein
MSCMVGIKNMRPWSPSTGYGVIKDSSGRCIITASRCTRWLLSPRSVVGSYLVALGFPSFSPQSAGKPLSPWQTLFHRTWALLPLSLCRCRNVSSETLTHLSSLTQMSRSHPSSKIGLELFLPLFESRRQIQLFSLL